MSGLTLAGVSVRRGTRTVLHGIDAAFPGGRLTAVIGPNGAGKSTLLEVAAGLLPPPSGEVRWGGVPLRAIGARALARRRAYLPQSPAVEWPISVERVVALGLTAHLPSFGDLPMPWRAAVDGTLARFDLVHLRHRPATQISGGELARVMLARATVGEPELLIADEPAAGLDPRHALEAGQRLRALADGGCTVIVALHDLDMALRIADHVLAVKAGRIANEGAAEDMLVGPVLSSLFELDVRVTRDALGGSVRFLG